MPSRAKEHVIQLLVTHELKYERMAVFADRLGSGRSPSAVEYREQAQIVRWLLDKLLEINW